MHPPEPTPRPTTLLQNFARFLLRVIGWHSVVVPPPAPKGIVVVYPHTSNWDFIIGLLFKLGAGLPIRWMGKDTLFRWPFRRLLVRLGGIPINRRAPTGFVKALLAEFDRSEWMWLAVAPEGTRRKVDRWRSGFYHIAHQAGVPIVGVGLDWGRRAVRIGPPFPTTGDEVADIASLQRFFADVRGRVADNAYPPPPE